MNRRTCPFLSSNRIPAWWQPLHEASGSDSVFLSAAWMQTWVGLYGGDFQGSWVHWEVDGRVVAGCLLVERVIRVRGIPFRSMYLNATGHAVDPSPLAEFNDVLHLPGHGQAVAADLADWLRQHSWSRLVLCGYGQAGAAGALLGALGHGTAEHVVKPSRYVDLATMGNRPFLSTLTGKAGTQARRNLREFELRLGEITVRRATDVAQALAFFSEMRELHVARWNRLGKTTSLSSSTVVAFHHRFIEASFDSGQVEMIRVGSAERPIGFLYNFVVRGKVSVFQTGFVYEPSSKWSPGMLTHALAIEDYRSRGLREYDFLAGDAPYKRTLSNCVRELLWTTVYRDRAWIRLLLLGRRLRDQIVQPERGAEVA
jgi:hypothetical protein